MTPRAKGVLIGLVGTTFWATTGIIISYLLSHYNLQPLTLAFWRDLIVALGLILGLRLVQPQALRIARRDVLFFLAYGFVGAGGVQRAVDVQREVQRRGGGDGSGV